MKKCILVCANCHRGIHSGIYSIPNNWKELYDNNIAQDLLNKLEQYNSCKIYYCQDCGKEISKGSSKCVDCAQKAQRTCARPTREELKKLIRTTPFTQIAAVFRVSDNAIRKWCDFYNLPRKKTIINQYSDAEWEKI